MACREAEARIEVWMAKHDHGLPMLPARLIEAGADQGAADTAALPTGRDGHRRQRECANGVLLDSDR
jgi:hypothetical protein